MPRIKSSTDLRNNYNEISAFCHQNDEPVFITKNGQGDLAVMSIETYELLSGKLELYRLLGEGEEDIQQERTQNLADAMQEIRNKLSRERI